MHLRPLTAALATAGAASLLCATSALLTDGLLRPVDGDDPSAPSRCNGTLVVVASAPSRGRIEGSQDLAPAARGQEALGIGGQGDLPLRSQVALLERRPGRHRGGGSRGVREAPLNLRSGKVVM